MTPQEQRRYAALCAWQKNRAGKTEDARKGGLAVLAKYGKPHYYKMALRRRDSARGEAAGV